MQRTERRATMRTYARVATTSRDFQERSVCLQAAKRLAWLIKRPYWPGWVKQQILHQIVAEAAAQLPHTLPDAGTSLIATALD